MHRRSLSLVLLAASQLVLAAQLCLTSPAAASPTPAPAPAPQAQSASQNPAPPDSVGSAAVPAAAPDPDANISATNPKKPIKVWTNEDVTGMSGKHFAANGDPRNAKVKTTPQAAPDSAYISSVRKQLQDLQNKMAAADKELLSLKNFSEGEPVGTADREFHKSYNSQPIAQQMTNLEAKKVDLQSKIDALLDEARKKGVEPGQLR